MDSRQKISIKSQKDFFSGLLFMGTGIAFAWGACSYTVGQAARMGPGYFPLMLGILMAIIGIVIALKALVGEVKYGDNIGSWAWKATVYVLGANLAFGALLGGLPTIKLPTMGMIIAIYALTIVASLAGDRFKLREVFILATILALGSYLAFIVLLKLESLPVWPAFISG
jgi:hypothetical protein